MERWLIAAIDAMGTVAAFLFASLALITSYDVLARTLFNSPTVWALETATYAMIPAVFIGGPYVLRMGEHIAIDVLTSRLPQRVAVLIHRLGLVLTAALFGCIAWEAFNMAVHSKSLGLESPTLYVPIWMVQASIPLGAAFTALEALRQLAAPFVARQP